jgi:hypothetical protein
MAGDRKQRDSWEAVEVPHDKAKPSELRSAMHTFVDLQIG